jgi:pyridoxal phosphate enzyme (YggS family)
LSILQNIARVREQIDSAVRRAARDPQNITLMAITKTVAPERIREAYAAGVRVFGENRVQEFAAKHDALADLKDADWHMVGHLQSNKAHAAAELFHAIDSVDSVRLLQRLNRAATELRKTLPVLIEINIGGEAAKSGVAPESSELEEMMNVAASCESIAIRGLMTVPPFDDDPEKSRPYFRKMRALFEQIAAGRRPAVRMQTLSMGMSHDFVVAIEEGSTCVRVGTAIFGERQTL